MQLWLLRPLEGLPEEDNPWDPWFDKCFGFVIRAETEAAARTIADAEAAAENEEEWSDLPLHPWLDATYSTCLPLLPEGDPGVIIQDVKMA